MFGELEVVYMYMHLNDSIMAGENIRNFCKALAPDPDP